jgi:SAM-dependent methyltransferase
MEEKIEILSVELLNRHRPLVTALRSLANALHIGLGWHYLLDMSWILANLGEARGKTILDAGAGTGLLQWYLAEQGARVLSVDRVSRAQLPWRFRARYHVRGLRPQDLHSPLAVMRENVAAARGIGKIKAALRGIAAWLLATFPRPRRGEVILYNQDLSAMADLPDESMDAVISVSALEHNSPSGLEQVVNELWRVLKPGGILLATLGAASQADWFHEPSQGWCYTEQTLRRLFRLPDSVPSNYHRYDEYFAALCACAELRDNLADFYFRSGNNGMPWGKWDPQYQPVGIKKIKEAPAA